MASWFTALYKREKKNNDKDIKSIITKKKPSPKEKEKMYITISKRMFCMFLDKLGSINSSKT
jgi:hypothetical protein